MNSVIYKIDLCPLSDNHAQANTAIEVNDASLVMFYR
jgi:hypothetical protein